MSFLKNNERNYMCEWMKSHFYSIFLFKQILRITSWKIFDVMQKIRPKERLSISNLLILQVTKEELLFTSSNILKLSSSSLSFSEQWCYLGSWKSQSNKKNILFSSVQNWGGKYRFPLSPRYCKSHLLLPRPQ